MDYEASVKLSPCRSAGSRWLASDFGQQMCQYQSQQRREREGRGRARLTAKEMTEENRESSLEDFHVPLELFEGVSTGSGRHVV